MSFLLFFLPADLRPVESYSLFILDNSRLWAHRQSQEDQCAQKRTEAELVGSLLADSARRNMQAEKENDGM